jgi:CDP-2,3-bis-(O-geranylgeranyl)-sn-glycerol synthase
MAPVLFRKVRFLDHPVDCNKRWRGRPLLGSHKTFRGVFFGILFSIIIVYFQKMLFVGSGYFRGISLIDYSQHNFVLLGFLAGFGVLFGDLVESFLKRRSGIRPGKPWIPWDQLDSVVGGLVFVSFVYIPPLSVLFFLVVSVPLLHILINHLGYYLGLRNSRW